jgi:hypothetical protein
MTDLMDLLVEVNKERSTSELGDRTLYVGSSDVAGCPRKAVLQKLQPVEHDSETIIRFERGKLAEVMFEPVFEKMKALSKITDFRTQYEVVKDRYKAHIDFLLKTNNHFKIIEMKSVSNIPNTVYDSWKNQVNWQMGLFKYGYPNCELSGTVFAIDLNSGEHQFFEIEYDDYLFKNILLSRAEKILHGLDSGDLPECEPDGLCSFCPYVGDCPAMQVKNADKFVEFNDVTLEQQIAELKEKQDLVKSLNNEISKLQNDIKYLAAKIGKIKVGRYYVSATPYIASKFNSTEFKKQYNDLYEQFLTKQEQIRLTIKEVLNE